MAIKKAPPLLQRADSYMASGVKHYHLYEYPAASKKFTRALYEYQGFHYVEGMARCRLNLAKTALALGEITEAEKQLVLARKIIISYHLTGLAQIDIMSSSLAIEKGDLKQAKTILAPYLVVETPGPEKNNAAYISALQNRTRIAFAEGLEQQTWTEKYQAAISLRPDKYQPRLLRFKAGLAITNNDSPKALYLLEQALEGYRQQANPKGVTSTMRELGKIREAKKEWQLAADAYENGWLAGYRILDKLSVIKTLTSLSAVYKQLGKTDKQQKVDQLISAIIASEDQSWHLLKRLD